MAIIPDITFTEIPPIGQRKGVFCNCGSGSPHAIHESGLGPTLPEHLVATDEYEPDQTTILKEPSGPTGSNIPSGDTHNLGDLPFVIMDTPSSSLIVEVNTTAPYPFVPGG